MSSQDSNACANMTHMTDGGTEGTTDGQTDGQTEGPTWQNILLLWQLKFVLNFSK